MFSRGSPEHVLSTVLLKLVQMCQSRQNNSLTRLLDFTRQEHLIQYSVNL
jgi:hypothetical protein